MRLVLATQNEHKLREFRALLAPHELAPLPSEVEMPPERGRTFAGNALAKARAAAAATGMAAIADDSGIEVAALGGEPGIRSARYAGSGASDTRNLARLLEAVAGAEDRRAAYICALALVWPDGGEELLEGRCQGRLAVEPRGAGGFGYDPVFLPDEYGGRVTMAELEPASRKAGACAPAAHDEAPRTDNVSAGSRRPSRRPRPARRYSRGSR